jgi:triacylglycerol lipase
VVSSPHVRRMDYLYIAGCGTLSEFLDYLALYHFAAPNLAPARQHRRKSNVREISRRIPSIHGTNWKVFPTDMVFLNLIRTFIVFFILLVTNQAFAAPAEHVVLLHGLARTSNSMNKLAKYLTDQGYQVVNIDYPSRRYPLAELAKIVRKEVISKTTGTAKIHFVTHSMGGIIVHFIEKNDPLPNIGRVVMLSPPNRGSEVVDFLSGLWFFESINGPAGKQLGTGANNICRNLGKVNFELGVITGDRSINWINSLIIPGKDDGKVSIESAKVEGMADFLIVHKSHPFIMNDKAVMAECLHFLRNGHFTNGPRRTL